VSNKKVRAYKRVGCPSPVAAFYMPIGPDDKDEAKPLTVEPLGLEGEVPF
jgi:hypothetical protein